MAKVELKSRIGGSPDMSDAVTMAVWASAIAEGSFEDIIEEGVLVFGEE